MVLEGHNDNVICLNFTNSPSTAKAVIEKQLANSSLNKGSGDFNQNHTENNNENNVISNTAKLKKQDQEYNSSNNNAIIKNNNQNKLNNFNQETKKNAIK